MSGTCSHANCCAALLLSKAYCAAMLTGVAEFAVRTWLLGPNACLTPVAVTGLVMVLFGDLIRKAAMVCSKPESKTRIHRTDMHCVLHRGHCTVCENAETCTVSKFAHA